MCVEPVGRDRYLRFGRGQRQRALDARAGLGPLGRPDHVRGGVAADQGGVDLAGDHLHAPLYMAVGVGCPPGAVPDQPAVPRHDVPELVAVLVDQAPGETEFGQRLGTLPSADLHHGRQCAAAVGLRLVRRMRPHLRRPVVSWPGRGRLGRLLAAVAEPAELARRGLVVPVMVEQRVGAKLGVDLAVGERRPVGGEHLQPVGVVRVPRGGRVAVQPVLARPGPVPHAAGLVVEHGAKRQQDVRPVGPLVEVVPSPALALAADGRSAVPVPARNRPRARPGLGQRVQPTHGRSRRGRPLTAGRFPSCHR